MECLPEEVNMLEDTLERIHLEEMSAEEIIRSQWPMKNQESNKNIFDDMEEQSNG